MSDSLSKSSGLSIESNSIDDEAVIEENLINKICNNSNIPAIGSSISSIVRQSGSSEGSVKELANLILSDVALTQKILHLSNSAAFCTSTGQEITSISVAIQLLGMDAIKTCALASILIDSLPDNQAQCVHIELAHALAASVTGRHLAKGSHFKNVEEVAIVALFKNIGRLLVAAYDSKLYWKIMTLVKQDAHSPAQASLQVMGFTFDTLAETALREWKIPEALIKAMRLLPTRVLTAPKTRSEWMQQAAEFSESVALHILQADEKKKESFNQEMIKRFGNTLNLSKAGLDGLLAHATKEAASLTNSARLVLPVNVQEEIGTSNTDDAYALLSVGLQKITELMSGTFKNNELIKLVLETLHIGMSSRFTTLCLKDVKAGQFRARYSLGDNHSGYQQGFMFPAVLTDDLFHLAMKKNVDLLISDTSSQKICALIPHWHSQLLPDARSLIILPLVAENKPIGLFYMDSRQVASESVTSKEMALLKTLKNQVLTTLIYDDIKLQQK